MIGAEGRQETVLNIEMTEAVPPQREEAANTVAPNTETTVIRKVRAIAAPNDPAAATTGEVSLKKVWEALLTKPIPQGLVVVGMNLYRVIIVVLV